MTVDLNARELGGVVALLEKFAPAAVAPLRRVAGRLAPARLHATIAIDRSTGGADAATSAKLSAMGTLGATKVSLIGEASGDPAAPRSARVELDGKLDADDGAALLRLLDLDRFLAVTTGAGQLSFSANGPLDGKLRVISRLTAGGLDVAAAGTAAWPKDAAVDAEFRLAVTRADASPLRPTGTVGTAGGLPVSLSTRVAIAGSKIALDALSGQVAGGDIRGNLKIAVDTPITIDGNIETDYLDARAVLAAAIGMPLDGAGAGAWSSDPFTAGALANVGGRIELRGARVAVSQHLDLDDLHAVVRLAPARFGLEDFAARLGGGRLAGALDIGRGVAGVTARMRLDVKDVATAAALLPATVSGRIAAHLEVEGSGLSPKALAGSVAGTGTLTLSDGRLAGIDARAFDTVTQAIDHGVPIEAGKIRNLVDASFAAGRVEVPVLTAPVTVASGQLRVARAQAQIGPAELSVGGSLDLVKGDVDARLVVSGPRGDFATLAGRPDVTVNLRGPYGEPKRSLDVSALVGWLTLRSVEQQARRLEAIESERRAPAIDKPVRGPAPSFRPPQNGAESESPVSARAVPLGRAGLDLLRPEPRNVVPSDSAPDQQTARTPSRTDRAPSLPPPLDIGPPPGAEHRQSAPLAPAARERTLFDSLIRP